MVARVVLAGLLASAVAAGLLAQTPAPPPAPAPEPESVADLAARLGAADFRQREAAGRALKARGTEALPRLKRCLRDATSPEAARRLESLIDDLEVESLTTPQRVTLSLKGVKFSEAVVRLGQAAGQPVALDPGASFGDARVSVEFADTPFLEAVDRLGHAAGASVLGVGGLLYQAGDSRRAPRAYAGPLRFTATHVAVNAGRQLFPPDPDAAAPNTQYSLSLQVLAEPRCRLYNVGLFEAVSVADDRGQTTALISQELADTPLAADALDVSGESEGAKSVSVGWALPAGAAAPASLRAVTVRGVVGTLREFRPLAVLDNLPAAKGKVWKLPGCEVTIEKLTVTNAAVEVAYTARRAAPDDETSWFSQYPPHLHAVDANGVRIPPTNSTINLDGVGTNTGTLSFVRPSLKAGRAVRLEYVEPVVHRREVRVTLKDVPLP